MVLDKGIAEFYKTVNTATAGEEPNDTLQLTHSSWYGDLDFVSTPKRSEGAQLVKAVEKKIRVIDGAGIIEGAVVKIGTDVYSVIKAWHGKKDGMDVADVELSREVYNV
jgi:hypothetical protein